MLIEIFLILRGTGQLDYSTDILVHQLLTIDIYNEYKKFPDAEQLHEYEQQLQFFTAFSKMMGVTLPRQTIQQTKGHVEDLFLKPFNHNIKLLQPTFRTDSRIFNPIHFATDAEYNLIPVNDAKKNFKQHFGFLSEYYPMTEIKVRQPQMDRESTAMWPLGLRGIRITNN